MPSVAEFLIFVVNIGQSVVRTPKAFTQSGQAVTTLTLVVVEGVNGDQTRQQVEDG
tara:strand:- start:176 stop:343 length:168 start_codon:yes stop_codon:yes gene_type:complete